MSLKKGQISLLQDVQLYLASLLNKFMPKLSGLLVLFTKA